MGFVRLHFQPFACFDQVQGSFLQVVELPPFRTWTESSPSPFPPKLEEEKLEQGLRPTPKSAWEEGRQRPLTYTKAQAGLAPPQEIWPRERISRDKDGCTASFNSGKSFSFLREKRQESGLGI
ncbi:TPA: hypothetical protein BOS_14603 [Bos taurus]|nr:TPA: hypothetical protein BOS_14603 [Bos taurus]